MSRFRSVAVFTVFAVLAAAPAYAQQQDKAQQACLNKVVKAARKIPGAVLKDAASCIKKGAGDALPMGVTADACLVADLKQKIAKAVAKLDATASDTCTTLPDFGFLDAPTASSAYEQDNQSLAEDAFGIDLDVALAASAGADPGGRCSATLPGAWRKLEDAMHRAVEACLKDGLKSGSIVSGAGFEACLDEIHADTRGKIGKATGLVSGKLASKCPSGSLAGIFPGLAGTCPPYGAAVDANGIASCSRDRLECRLCRIFNFAYGLDRDCDLFDDGEADASCPDCGNGAIDSGEGCDDGNVMSGDGCSALCADEFCGDGAINDNGAEECDDGPLNDDETPGACRENCELPNCGDAIHDPGEECDDGNDNETDGCTSQCTSCGNGTTGGSEQCDDGNNLSGDCCSPSCTFEALGSSCSGSPGAQCTVPGCDGAGECTDLPAGNGAACEDDNECSTASACLAGICTGTSFYATGNACRFGIVGTANNGRVFIENGTDTTGQICGDFAEVEGVTTIADDVIAMKGDVATPAMKLDVNAAFSASADIVTNNDFVEGLASGNLPGLVATSTVAAGQVVAKSPGGEYDTTGSDERVGQCSLAQVAVSTYIPGRIDDLPAPNPDLGTAMASLAGGSTYDIHVANPGGLNRIKVDSIGGGTNVTVNIHGGNNPGTVLVLEVEGVLNTAVGWDINLVDGLTADHFLIYGKASGGTRCEIGDDNTGAGTIVCPDTRIFLKQNTVWSGAVLGGGTSATAIDLGENVAFTHVRFTGF
jgi:cysteine-rich repeat protein